MAWPLKYETGVTHYDRAKAYTGYTLVTPFPEVTMENSPALFSLAALATSRISNSDFNG